MIVMHVCAHVCIVSTHDHIFRMCSNERSTYREHGLVCWQAEMMEMNHDHVEHDQQMDVQQTEHSMCVDDSSNTFELRVRDRQHVDARCMLLRC